MAWHLKKAQNRETEILPKLTANAICTKPVIQIFQALLTCLLEGSRSWLWIRIINNPSVGSTLLKMLCDSVDGVCTLDIIVMSLADGLRLYSKFGFRTVAIMGKKRRVILQACYGLQAWAPSKTWNKFYEQ
jgi:hypothetical protein